MKRRNVDSLGAWCSPGCALPDKHPGFCKTNDQAEIARLREALEEARDALICEMDATAEPCNDAHQCRLCAARDAATAALGTL